MFSPTLQRLLSQKRVQGRRKCDAFRRDPEQKPARGKEAEGQHLKGDEGLEGLVAAATGGLWRGTRGAMTTSYFFIFPWQEKKFGQVREARIFLPELDLNAWLRGGR